MSKKLTKIEYEQYLYHNTEKLLKCYREVVWSVEVSLVQKKYNFEIEMGCPMKEFLDMSYAAGADLKGTDIEEQIRTVERNKNMLEIIEMSVNMVRKKQIVGETYYWILYYTYLSEKEFIKTEDIVDAIAKHVDIISYKLYYKKRKEAISCLNKILWGFTTKETFPIIKTLNKPKL